MRSARRVEAIQRLRRDLPDFAGGEDIFGLQALQRGPHVGGSVEIIGLMPGLFMTLAESSSVHLPNRKNDC